MNLFGLTEDGLGQALGELGVERYRARQIFYWLYNRRAAGFDEMHNLPKALRARLAERFTIAHPAIAAEQRSADGTRKFLVTLADGLAVETVLIPSESAEDAAPKRLTLCVSTQVGCALGCRFCATASMRLRRNLDRGEILGQYAAVQNASDRRITNLVFMGMGEPLQNYEAVMDAASILSHETTCGVGAAHITVSTAGLPDGIRRMADEGRRVKLAISLHATTDEQRARLMPIGARHGIEALLEAAAYYYRKTRRRITYEYILFAGVNDSDEDARRLAKLSRRVPSKVNLIPFHPIDSAWPGGAPLPLLAPTAGGVERFAAQLRALNVTVMLRSSAGRDIDAACGQLAVKTQRQDAESRRK
jgi:23S rRNA (adenine2503-C2)-methyltransferase